MIKKINFTSMILEMENSLKLYQWTIDEVFIWELIRVEIYLKIQENKNSQSFGIVNSVGIIKKIKISAERLMCDFFIVNPFFNLKRKSIFVIRSSRRYLLNNDEYGDIYTHFIAEKLNKDKKQIEVFETNFQFKNKNTQVKNLDLIIIFGTILSKFISKKIVAKDEDIINKIERYIFKMFQVHINLRTIIKNNLSKFKSELLLYKTLLKIKKPTEIYLVNYSNFFALIAAAKNYNIVVKELQHGILVKDALTYHFPNVADDDLVYFPDQFLYWSGFKYNSSKLPLSSNNIIANPYNHLEFMKLKYTSVIQEKKSILIVSQPFYSDELQKYILHNACKMPDYKFYYKIHPMEFTSFFNSSLYGKFKDNKNIEIVQTQYSVYELLKKCKFTLGIYSSVLFEAYMFNSIILIFNIDLEGFTDQLKDGKTKLVEPREDLLKYL